MHLGVWQACILAAAATIPAAVAWCIRFFTPDLVEASRNTRILTTVAFGAFMWYCVDDMIQCGLDSISWRSQQNEKFWRRFMAIVVLWWMGVFVVGIWEPAENSSL